MMFSFNELEKGAPRVEISSLPVELEPQFDYKSSSRIHSAEHSVDVSFVRVTYYHDPFNKRAQE